MLDAVALSVAALTAACAHLIEGREDQSPAVCVIAFHKAVAAGRLEEIGNFFSFTSAYRYWQDVTAALGIKCGDEESFRGLVIANLAGEATRARLSSYAPERFRVKVIGSVASVVFDREGSPGFQEAVASVVVEGGRWKVRTYPGAFPGELLSRVAPV